MFWNRTVWWRIEVGPDRLETSGSGKQVVLTTGPGHSSGRCALLQMVENGPDDVWVRNVRDNPQRSAAARANGDVNFKHTLQPLPPGEGCGWRLLIGGRFSRFGPLWFP